MNAMAILMFKRAANEARQTIGKAVVLDYAIQNQPGSIGRAFQTAFYHDARAAQTIEKRDLALAEAQRQIAPTTE